MSTLWNTLKPPVNKEPHNLLLKTLSEIRKTNELTSIGETFAVVTAGYFILPKRQPLRDN
jgi:hypothetical protein